MLLLILFETTKNVSPGVTTPFFACNKVLRICLLLHYVTHSNVAKRLSSIRIKTFKCGGVDLVL
jgi:hypothetical protein